MEYGGEAEEAVRIPVNQIRATLGIVEPNAVALGPRGGHEAGQHGQEGSGTQHGASTCQGDSELVEALTNKPTSEPALEGNTYDVLQLKLRNPGYTTDIYATSRQVPGVNIRDCLGGWSDGMNNMGEKSPFPHRFPMTGSWDIV